MERTHKEWTEQEKEMLIKMGDIVQSDIIAAILNRNVNATRTKLTSLGKRYNAENLESNDITKIEIQASSKNQKISKYTVKIPQSIKGTVHLLLVD